jgi:hypothetical protein
MFTSSSADKRPFISALLICALSLLTACELEGGFTPSPPPITVTPSVDKGGIGEVTWTSQEDALLLSFYLVALGPMEKVVEVVPSAGTAHLQVSKRLVQDGCVKNPVIATGVGIRDNDLDGSRCLIFDVEAEVQAADFTFEFKRYVDPGSPRDWQSGWHYWYTFVVPWEAALESYGDETAYVDFWFEHPDGSVGVWRWETAFREGRLREPVPFEPPRY